ncbi:ABC transporter permease [Alteraurantiacibacter aquimixticola]|uniref:ABC transporter permease n=1 Tax=Alteraurantiacibacter aquimixticola TaxID=2489173 RepID=A0A4T3F9I3_9SPHN|nr:ABC transporter permease [Alteraurantiacibacter aquimixticola]TIX51680.1 ABC transporter permease [Alteraurantiacibacter aquimixticola]
MIRLVLAYLGENRLTSALNVILLAIPVAMLVLLLQFARQSEERFLAGAEGIDLVVGAKGSPLQLVLSSVYHLDRPTGNIPLAELERLRSNPLVASAIPLALGDQFDGFRIVGTEAALLELYDAHLARGRPYARPFEAVIGAEVARTTGARIGQRFVGSHGLAAGDEGEGHEATPFEVVGILAPTGKPVDRLILTSVESVWDVHGIEHHDEEAGEGGHEDEHAHDEAKEGLHEGEAEITAILLSYRNPSAAVRLPSYINRGTNLQAASPARESTRLILLFEPAIRAVGAFALLLAIAGALAIFISLWSTMRSRQPDLALLRVMGASRGAIFRTVLLEGVMTAGLAALAGIALAHAMLWAASRAWQGVSDAGIVAGRIGAGEGVLFLATLAVGTLAALLPAWGVTRSHLAPILQRN